MASKDAIIETAVKYGIGMTFGVFDLIHFGHISFIARAKQ